MKKFFFILIFLSGFLQAQDFERDWRGYFSFTNVTDIAEGNDNLIVASENAIFIYDLITKDLETITSIQGLSGENISTIHYSEEREIIFIGYQTGLIELILEDKTVLRVVDIINKPTIPPNQKAINGFNEVNGLVYIATDYGISVYDILDLEFGDSYYIGVFGGYTKVFQAEVLGNDIYACTDFGVRRASLDSDLINYEVWETISGNQFVDLQTFAGNMFAISSNNQLFRYNGSSFQVVYTFPQNNLSLYVDENYLTVTSNTRTHTFDTNLTLVNTVSSVLEFEDYRLSSALAYGNTMYLGTTEYGVLAVPFGSIQAEQIVPDGPLLNNPFALDTSAGQLWVVFGEHTVSYNPYPLRERGISHLQDEIWTNIPFEEVLGARSISHVKINPNDPSLAYASSFIDGLLKIENTTPSALFDGTNSSIEIPNNPGVGYRILGSDFDSSGNLWFVQSMTNTGLHKMSPSGQTQGFDISNIISDPEAELALTRLATERQGNVFFGSNSNGLIGYNPSLNKFIRIGEGLGTGNLASANVRSLAVDKRNQLWIGTFKGLRVLYNVSGFFEDGANIDTQAIIILEDGIPQELLYQQTIADIEVDGANNKWIATTDSGVFLLSPNGQETLARFTKNNSPLPSNTILDIAIDPASGEVFFATPNGLISFKGSTTAPNPNLQNLRAYPNPVRPGFNGNVTIDGLTANANVKVTDVSGNLVFEQISQGGSILWDTTAFGKYKVASGVYFIMATTEDAMETKIAKVMIIR